mmetsp:Transcript_13032/g.26718  ORF Transcript_13032/g.26718 Transcript_13032/m.26718 type:complete len:255 (+) Transcript_13032:1058-1822(+)
MTPLLVTAVRPTVLSLLALVRKPTLGVVRMPRARTLSAWNPTFLTFFIVLRSHSFMVGSSAPPAVKSLVPQGERAMALTSLVCTFLSLSMHVLPLMSQMQISPSVEVLPARWPVNTKPCLASQVAMFLMAPTPSWMSSATMAVFTVSQTRRYPSSPPETKVVSRWELSRNLLFFLSASFFLLAASSASASSVMAPQVGSSAYGSSSLSSPSFPSPDSFSSAPPSSATTTGMVVAAFSPFRPGIPRHRTSPVPPM